MRSSGQLFFATALLIAQQITRQGNQRAAANRRRCGKPDTQIRRQPRVRIKVDLLALGCVDGILWAHSTDSDSSERFSMGLFVYKNGSEAVVTATYVATCWNVLVKLFELHHFESGTRVFCFNILLKVR